MTHDRDRDFLASLTRMLDARSLIRTITNSTPTWRVEGLCPGIG
jgi:hypothetical protein